MKITTLLTLALSLAVVTNANASLQGKKKKKSQEPAKVATKGAAADASNQLALVFAVEGLTADNQQKVRANLGALSATMWTCAACSGAQAKPGNCPKCKTALKESEVRPVQRVETQLEKGMVGLLVDKSGRVGLEQVKTALVGTNVHLEPARLSLGGASTLKIEGAKEADAKKIEQALKQPALFSAAAARFDQQSGRLNVDVTVGAQPPAHAAVVAALHRVGTGIELSDVIFRMTRVQPQATQQRAPAAGKKDGGKKKKKGKKKNKGK
ncbi:MAG: hypothetical protein ACI8Y8_002039 [Planctomycetota bacterium]|jgi:hypothetical protein